MKILWISAPMFLLSVIAYSAVSSVPRDPPPGIAALDASTGNSRKSAQTATAPASVSARNGNNVATDLSPYVLLHKTRYESNDGRVEAHANTCAE